MYDLDHYLKKMVEHEASDLFVSTELPISAQNALRMPSCKRVPLFRTHPKAPLVQDRSGLVAVKKVASPPSLSNSRLAVGN